MYSVLVYSSNIASFVLCGFQVKVLQQFQKIKTCIEHFTFANLGYTYGPLQTTAAENLILNMASTVYNHEYKYVILFHVYYLQSFRLRKYADIAINR